MARVFPPVEISQILPWLGYRRAGEALEPRRLWATVASAFFVVAVMAWALALLQQGVAARAFSLTEEPVAFQPSRMFQDAVAIGYVSP